jgi:D-alanine-D-alanine ligase
LKFIAFYEFLKNLSISIIFMGMRIGILFGGNSREREVSFAGGRTVYDNLNKSLFTPIPIFIDSRLNLCLLDWSYIYKGSIRDFYDPENLDSELLKSYPPSSEHLKSIGTPIPLEDLRKYIDFAFLTLHGENGEDGRIQGILEWLEIPYSGSGLFSSAIGMDKALQKNLLRLNGFPVPPSLVFSSGDWDQLDKHHLFDQCRREIGFPMVIKSAHQGSSIGVHILREDSFKEFSKKVERCLFIETLDRKDWFSDQKQEIVRHILDYREGPGLPAEIEGKMVY